MIGDRVSKVRVDLEIGPGEARIKAESDGKTSIINFEESFIKYVLDFIKSCSVQLGTVI